MRTIVEAGSGPTIVEAGSGPTASIPIPIHTQNNYLIRSALNCTNLRIPSQQFLSFFFF